MLELKLPLDFERLPEFWQLCATLRGEAPGAGLGALGGEESKEAVVEQTAVLLWVRLWVVLGYLARSTNRPGWLNAAGEAQVNAAFHQFGEAEEDRPVAVLVRSGLLRAGPAGAMGAAADGLYCDLFTSTNRHLAGDFLTPAQKGNRHSINARQRNAITQAAVMQVQLLPPEVFRNRAGAAMDARQIERSTVLIMTLDRVLPGVFAGRAGTGGWQRPRGEYTQGLMADACHVVDTTPAEELQDFYNWLAERREHPATPKSAEHILREWDKWFNASQQL